MVCQKLIGQSYKKYEDIMIHKKIWLDGQLVPWDQANIHVMTHTLHYGSGAFEGIRCYDTERGPAIFRLPDHIKRLLNSFACFGASIPWSQSDLEQAVISTIRANNLRNCYIRPILFFGSESILLNPMNLSVHCAVIALDMDKYLDRSGVKVGISNVLRISPNSIPVHNKLNGLYINSILAFQDVKQRGFDEALLLDQNGYIAEGSVANVFFVIDGTLVTPTTESILPGITRDTVIQLAGFLNMPVSEIKLSRSEIASASEAFFTGTASEITPIKSIEMQSLKVPGAMNTKIKEAYQEAVLGRSFLSENWLTFIN